MSYGPNKANHSGWYTRSLWTGDRTTTEQADGDVASSSAEPSRARVSPNDNFGEIFHWTELLSASSTSSASQKIVAMPNNTILTNSLTI